MAGFSYISYNRGSENAWCEVDLRSNTVAGLDDDINCHLSH